MFQRTLVVVTMFVFFILSCSGESFGTEPMSSSVPTSIQETGETETETETETTYTIVDTNQTSCYDDAREISCPAEGEAFYGQDGQYSGTQPSYVDNGDGTVTDHNTGLMWQQGYTEVPWEMAAVGAESAETGGYSDWRLPTIKELYSLVDFTGNQGTADPNSTVAPDNAVPFIDTDYFEFEYPSDGNLRYIDAQIVSSTNYVGLTMDGAATFFGFNFADGRIKGYPQVANRKWYVRYVRGNSHYGVNDFADNEDGTISDKSTDLMWMQHDSGDAAFVEQIASYTNTDGSLNWEESLDFCETLSYAGYDDWRLPNAKELHSILDYTRAPDVTDSAAIDPIFESTSITNEAGQSDYPAYWTSTTFRPGADAVLIFFGRALGYMDLGSGPQFYDVHGAGAQRTDPKAGTPTYGFGPQGDVRRVYNFVRCVRDEQPPELANLLYLPTVISS